MRSFVRLVSLFVLTLSFSECARILGVFPSPPVTNQIIYQKIVRDLAARGHQLTTITADPIAKNKNVTQIDVTEFYKENLKTEDCSELLSDLIDWRYCTTNARIETMNTLLSHPDVEKLINSTAKFDLVIFEYLPEYLSAAAFKLLFNCPAIAISSGEPDTPIHNDFGNEGNIGIHPAAILGYDESDLSMIERVKSAFYEWKFHNSIVPTFLHKTNVLVRDHFKSIITYANLLKEDIDLLMINTSPALGFVRPIVPNVIQLGLMNVPEPKPLPNGTLKDFIENSKAKGIIFMNIGGEMFDEFSLTVLKRVCKTMAHDIIWQHDNETLKVPANILIGKSFPQADILAHPKTKAFITDGALQSIEEAIDRAVPMVVIPTSKEKENRAKWVDKKGLGVHLKLIITNDVWTMRAVYKALSPELKEKITEFRDLVYDQPMTSSEKAVWWCEHVIRRNGTSYLNYPGKSASFMSRYYMDVAVFAYIAYRIAKRILRMVLSILWSLFETISPEAKVLALNLWKKFIAWKNGEQRIEAPKKPAEEIKEKEINPKAKEKSESKANVSKTTKKKKKTKDE